MSAKEKREHFEAQLQKRLNNELWSSQIASNVVSSYRFSKFKSISMFSGIGAAAAIVMTITLVNTTAPRLNQAKMQKSENVRLTQTRQTKQLSPINQPKVAQSQNKRKLFNKNNMQTVNFFQNSTPVNRDAVLIEAVLSSR